MSTAKFKLVDEQSGKEKAFDSRSAAEEKKQELDGLGDYYIERVKEHGNGNGNGNGYPPENGDATDAADAPAESDGGPDVVEPTPERNGDVSPTRGDETVGAIEAMQDSIESDPLDVLPGYMITTVEGTPTLNKRGVSVLAYHYDVSVLDHEYITLPSETDHEHAVVRIRVRLDDGRTFTGTGEASADEVGASKLLRMAETRAYKRAVIFATGTGIVGYQELVGELE